MHTLGTAAKATGKSKATIHRAIKSGLISADRQPDGSYRIQPAELHRVFAPASHETGSVEPVVRQVATFQETPETRPGTGETDVSLAIANARLEAEIAGLKELVRLHASQVDDLREERNRLLTQVEASQRLLTHFQAEKAVAPAPSWWRRVVG